MAVPRALSFLRLGTGSQSLEVYLDPVCPFSAKILRSLSANVIPLVQPGGKYEKELSVVLWPYPQPFHYFGNFGVEALLVFGTKYPKLFLEYFHKARLRHTLKEVERADGQLMDAQDGFKNRPVADMTPNQARDRLTDLALEVLEAANQVQGPKSKIYGELRAQLDVQGASKEGDNKGSTAFDLMKHAIKIGRQNSIHITPTVLFDGLRYDSVSSSWGKEEWEKWLAERLA